MKVVIEKGTVEEVGSNEGVNENNNIKNAD